MRATRTLLAAACVLLVSCTETIHLSRDPLAELVAIEVLPSDATIKIIDLAPPHLALQYTALGRFADGTTRDVTPLVQWSVDNGFLGAFDDSGLFTASHAAAGYGTVTIEARGLAASAALTVIIDATIIDPEFPPPGPGLFDPSRPYVTDDPTQAPALIYPADGTLFPHSIASTLFQYKRGSGNDAFRLVFDSEVIHLGVETGSDRWQADGPLQRLLAASGIVAPIRAEIHGTASTGSGPIYVGNRVTLQFSKDAPGGPLYYWSAATNGIMRGAIDMTTAGKLYPGSTTCVGCHAISRDGSELAMGFDSTTSTDLTTIDTTTLAPRIAPSTTRPMGWATYSPDGDKLLVANNGALALYDTATGARLGTVPLPPMRYATHPDWSPDGTYIAVALTNQAPTNMEVKSASIARIPYNGGAWGTPEILVASAPMANNYFPKFSPDGTHLAFVRASTASQGAASAKLMVVFASGGSPRELRLANSRVGTLADVPDLANTMPAWSPKEGERAWLAFVSSRPYGAVLPTAGRGQIWVTSLDLTTPGDPSSAAFWLPCQDITVLNNNPAWAKTEFTK